MNSLLNKTGATAALLLGLLLAVPVQAAQDTSLLGTLKINNARLPLYRDGVLDYFLHSKTMTRLGSNFNAVSPIVDSIRPHADVNKIAGYNDSGIYPLYAPLSQVMQFWLQRDFSRGILTADQADIDQANRIVAGEGPIHIRSLLMDLDGKGFQADFNTRQAKIHQEVRIVLRFGGDAGSLTADSTGEMLKGTSQVKAFSNTLAIDGAAGMIVLDGAVRVEEERATITADRLELMLTQKSQKDAKKDANDPGSLGGLDRVCFIGNVHVVRAQTADEIADRGVEHLYADRLVYDVATTDLELTGKNPILIQGKDFIRSDRILMNRDREKLHFFENVRIETRKVGRPGSTPDTPDAPVCAITGNYAELDYPENHAILNGNVLVDHPAENVQLTCDRIDIYLTDKNPQKDKADTQALVSAISNADPLQFSSGGSKKVESLVCRKAVRLVRKTADGDECATAETATFFPNEERILMQGTPQLSRNSDSISGGEMEYFIAKEQLLVRNGSLVCLDSVRIDPQSRKLVKTAAASGNSQPLLVRSQCSDLNFGGNLLTFQKNVDADNQTQKLTCDTLQLQLADARKAPEKKSPDTAGRKKLITAVCTGKVAGHDPQADLFCDELRLDFGEKAVPGKTDLEKITAIGNVKMESIQEKTAKKGKGKRKKKKKVQVGSLFARNPSYQTTLLAQRGIIDLLANTGDFYENVRIFDPVNELMCEHLHFVGGLTEDEIPQLGSIRLSDDTEFPERVGLGSGRELLQVVAQDNVKLRRVVPATKELQKVVGNQADYVIAKRTVVLTGTPEKRPEALAVGGKSPGGMVGDKVTVFLDSEDIEVENGESLTHSGNFAF